MLEFDEIIMEWLIGDEIARKPPALGEVVITGLLRFHIYSHLRLSRFAPYTWPSHSSHRTFSSFWPCRSISPLSMGETSPGIAPNDVSAYQHAGHNVKHTTYALATPRFCDISAMPTSRFQKPSFFLSFNTWTNILSNY